MIAKVPRSVQRYTLAAAAVVAAVLVTLFFRQWITLNPTPLLLAAAVAAGWFGGLGPGLLAAVLIDLATDYFFETPPYQFTASGAHFMRLAVLAVIVILAHARKNAERKLRVGGLQQAAVAELGRRALATQDIGTLFAAAAAAVRRTLEVDYAAVYEAADGGLVLRAGTGWERDPTGAVAEAGSQADATMSSEAALVARDLTRERRFTADPIARESGVRGSASVAIHVDDRPFGVLAVYCRTVCAFTQQDTAFLESIANVIAAAVHRLDAERAVREHREWLRTTLSSIGDAVIATDGEGQITFMNTVASDLTGYSEEEAVGRPISAVFRVANEDSGEPVANPVRRVLDEGLVVGLANHTVLVAADGRRIPIEDSGAPIRTGDGEVTGVVLVFHDVTERRRAEEALRNQQQWLRSVLDLAPTPILLVEPGTGLVTFANGAASELAGGEYPKDVPVEELDERFYCTDREGNRISSDQMPVSRVARGERIDGYELDWHTPDGSRSLLIFGETLPGMHGHEATGILVYNDISPLREIEEQLRTADRLKDEFLTTVSHELRTPLNPIVGWVAMLRAGDVDEATHERALETIDRNVRAQLQIIDDLLDVSRIISGKLRFEPRSIEVGPVVRAAIGAVQSAAEAKGIEIRTDFDDAGDETFWGDPDRLQQIVWNLLSNAVKFTEKGGTVDLRLERTDAELRISVTDTGRGIDPAFLPYVFERFRQADGSTTRSYGGLGLGLSIARHLTEMHGGTIRAESDGEGHGATFTVTLPVKAGKAAEEPVVEPRRTSVPPAERPDLSSIRVLVVDDDPDTLEYIEMALTMCGAEVVTAGSADDALERLDGGSFDVLVSDVAMPNVDGYELIERVRAREASRNNGWLPAAALTAYTRAEDRERALASGFQAHIGKPVDLEDLTGIVARLAAREEG